MGIEAAKQMIDVDDLEKGISFDIFSHITSIGNYKVILLISFYFLKFNFFNSFERSL